MRRLTLALLLLLTAMGALHAAQAADPPVASAVPAPAATAPATASPLTHPDGDPAGLGDTAPDFTLSDTDGQPHHLADYLKQGKIVVLEWFCPACSMCEEYYKPGPQDTPSRMEKIIASIAGPDTVWLSINSTGPKETGGSLSENVQTHAQWKMSAPLLLDPTGAVGQAYDAEYTPTIFIINPSGKLVYAGAPDDGGAGVAYPGINFVGRAIAQLRAKQDISVFVTEPFGCPVDYAAPQAATTPAQPPPASTTAAPSGQ